MNSLFGRSLGVLTVGVMLAWPAVGVAQTDELTKRTEEMVRDIAAQFSTQLSGRDRDIARSIKYIIDPDGSRYCAGADYSGVSRVVQLSTAYVGGAMLAGEVQAFVAFGVIDARLYEDYLSLMAHVDEFTDLPTPSELYRVELDEWKGDRGLLEDAVQFGGPSTVAFVLAHELAHHVLGHTGSPSPVPSKTLAREIAADRWAAAFCARQGIAPAWATSHMMLLRVAELYEPSQAEKSSHPAGEERVLNMLSATAEMMEEYGPLLNDTAQERLGTSGLQLVSRFRQSLDSLRETISELSDTDTNSLERRSESGDFLAFATLTRQRTSGSRDAHGDRERAWFGLQEARKHIAQTQRFAYCWVNYELGVLTRDGVSVRIVADDSKAVDYFRLAARLGHKPSIRALEDLNADIIQRAPDAQQGALGFAGNWAADGKEQVLYRIEEDGDSWDVEQPDAGPWEFRVTEVQTTARTLKFRTEIKYTDGSHPFSGQRWRVELHLVPDSPGVLRMRKLYDGEAQWESEYLTRLR